MYQQSSLASSTPLIYYNIKLFNFKDFLILSTTLFKKLCVITNVVIVNLLGSIDDKIENNEKIIEKLGCFALRFFNQIFKNAEECYLYEIADITMGQSPRGETYNTDSEGMTFFQGRTDFGNLFPVTRLYTTDPKRTAKQNDILLSVRAPVGDLNFAKEDCCIGRGLAAITSSRYIDSIYYALIASKSLFDIYNGTGTIFGSINKDQLKNFKLPFKNFDLLNKFNNIAVCINNKRKSLSKMNIRLNKLKQLYLQKFFN